MKAIVLGALIAAGLLGCSKDPIGRTAARASRNKYFANGMFPNIPLPASATCTQVVSAVLEKEFVVPAATNFTILEVRQVRIRYGEEVSNPNYTAVLVDTFSGRKVALLQYLHVARRGADSWWSRVYDAD